MMKFVHFVHSEIKLSMGIADTVGGQERLVIDFPATEMLSHVHIYIYIHFALLNCIRMHRFSELSLCLFSQITFSKSGHKMQPVSSETRATGAAHINKCCLFVHALF